MEEIIALLMKWWAFGALVVLCAGASVLLVSRLASARRENSNRRKRQ